MAIDLSSLSGATQLTKEMASSGNPSTYATTFATPQGDFTFISEDVINKGMTDEGTTYWLPWFQNKENLAQLNQVGQYVDLTDVKASGITAKDTWGNWVKDRLGQSPKGYIVPAGSINVGSAGVSSDRTDRIGTLIGLAQDPSGNLVYRSSGGRGNMYVTPTGEVHDPYITYESSLLGKWFGGLGESVAGAVRGVGDIIQGLGPIGTIAGNAALPGLGTGLSLGTALGRGADPADVLKSVAIGQALGAVTDTGGAVPSTAGTDTAFLQDMDQGIFVDTTDTTLSPAFVQDMSQGIEPLAPVVPETLDPAFLQDMDQGITPEVNLEGGDLGMTEAEAQDQYYRDIGIDPSTVTDTPAVPTTGDTPEVPAQTTPSLNPQQIYQLLKLGAGLFGGGGALAAAAKGIMGGNTGVTGDIGGGTALPTIQAPTPFTGTYSGMNMNDPAYYQQVQQNYNRLFPTTPANVAGPLESWYQTKYVPDTTISNKLFGV